MTRDELRKKYPSLITAEEWAESIRNSDDERIREMVSRIVKKRG